MSNQRKFRAFHAHEPTDSGYAVAVSTTYEAAARAVHAEFRKYVEEGDEDSFDFYIRTTSGFSGYCSDWTPAENEYVCRFYDPEGSGPRGWIAPEQGKEK